MVLIVKRLEDFKQCLKYARYPLYRIIEHDDVVEVRIKAGRIGWEGSFKKDDPRLEELRKLLDTYGGVEVKDAKPDELFLG